MCKCGCEALNALDGYTAEELEARPKLTSIYVMRPDVRHPMRFIKTTAAHWKYKQLGFNTWLTHEQLAELIQRGTVTDFKGEPL